MDGNCRYWIWEVRSKLHFERSLDAVDNWLDLDLECLRECLIEAYSNGKVRRSQRILFEDSMHCLTSLRYSNPFAPRWITTALPAWDDISRAKKPISILDAQTYQTMMSVLDFLDGIESRIAGAQLNWRQIRSWIVKELQGETSDLCKMD